jgi:hypothetical protein
MSSTPTLKQYNILNSIKPKRFHTKFPYTEFSQEKVIFTHRKLELKVKEYTTSDSSSDSSVVLPKWLDPKNTFRHNFEKKEPKQWMDDIPKPTGPSFRGGEEISIIFVD